MVESQLHWYVYQTGPNQEFLAERQLNRQRFSTYVPCEMVNRTRLGTVVGHERRALFRSYGFVQLDIAISTWRKVWNTIGVKRLISTTPEHPLPLPDGTIEALQRAELMLTPEHDIVAIPVPDVQDDKPVLLPDQEVEVLSGSFSGRTGIVQSSHGERVKLLMDILGSRVPVSFRVVNLRLLQTRDNSNGT